MNNRLLYFDTLFTPKVITIIYWIGLVGVVIFGLTVMFGGFGGFSFTKLLLGLVYIAIGLIAVRIWCELLIVTFKINEHLESLDNKTGGGESRHMGE